MSALPSRPRNTVPLSLPAPKLPPALVAALPIRRRVQLVEEGTDRTYAVTVQLDDGSAPPRGAWADVPLVAGLTLRLKLET